MEFRTYHEHIELSEVDIIIDNFSEIVSQFSTERQKVILRDTTTDYLQSLKKVKRFVQSRDTLSIPTTYNFSKKDGINLQGRLFAQNPSLQGLPREFRNTICKKNMVDFDFENCHFSLLNTFCINNNIKHDSIEFYCNNRDKVIKTLIKTYENNKLERQNIKNGLLAILNGGDASFLNDEFTNNLRDDIKQVHMFVKTNNPIEYKQNLKKKEKGKLFSPCGSLINKILCDMERKALEQKNDFIETKGFIPSVLMFDGIMAENPNNVIVDPTLLNDISKYVNEKTGFNIKVVSKPIERLDLSGLKTKKQIQKEKKDILDKTTLQKEQNKTDLHNIETLEKIKQSFELQKKQNKSLDELVEQYIGLPTDHNCALILYEFVKNKVKSIRNEKGNNEFFICNSFNVWEHNAAYPLFLQSFCHNELAQFIQSHHDILQTKYRKTLAKDLLDQCKTLLKLIHMLGGSHYNRNVIDCLAIYTNVDKFDEMLDTNTDIFCFQDKLYDLIKNEIRDIQPNDYVSKTTGYLFPDKSTISEETFDKVMKFCNDIMPNPEMRQLNLDRITMCLSGYNKFEHIYILTGKGSNGKSCGTTLDEVVFGDLSYCFNSQTFTEKSRGKNETNELAKTKGMRYAYTQEPDDDAKLQVSVLKTITSDKITTRDLYKSAISFKPQFKLNMACNNIPKLSGVDGGISRRLVLIEFEMRFCDVPTLPNERLADRSLTKEFESNHIYRDAFLHILLDNWKNRVCKLDHYKLPSQCLKMNNEYFESCNELTEFITEYYEIVPFKSLNRDEDNKITFKKLYEHFRQKNRNLGINNAKFKNRLELIKGITVKMLKDVKEDKRRVDTSYVFGIRKQCRDNVEFDSDDDE
jgi:P4 family phage/plasmid primase-like protien